MSHQQHYLIFGATGGIGSVLTQQLTSQGAKVSIAARNQEKLSALHEQTGATDYSVDAADFKAVDTVVQQAQEAQGPLHGVVNCVGSILLKPAHLITEAEWMAILTTNLTTSFAITKAACKAMMKTGGSIVLSSTAACLEGIPNHEAISAAKAGVNGLTLAAAASYAANNIRVNAVAPGLVATPLTEIITQNEKALAASLGMHPLGRIGQPNDIANAIAFLLDPDNDWITGQIIAIDGGLSRLKKL